MDQSEDRVSGPLYLVVGYEHAVFGTVHYVQNPSGERSSIYSLSAAEAQGWAIIQQANHGKPLDDDSFIDGSLSVGVHEISTYSEAQWQALSAVDKAKLRWEALSPEERARRTAMEEGPSC